MELKQCGKCKETKSLDNFYKDTVKQDGHHGFCKTCYYNSRDKTIIRQYNVKYQKWIILKKKYNITKDQFKQMFVSQGGKCAICELDFINRRNIHVDHDHKTNNTRQLLCSNCNTALGLFNEDVTTILQAINYLNKWKSQPN